MPKQPIVGRIFNPDPTLRLSLQAELQQLREEIVRLKAENLELREKLAKRKKRA